VNGIMPREAQYPGDLGRDRVIHKELHALPRGKARSLTASAA
jgi:hypothetical protein